MKIGLRKRFSQLFFQRKTGFIGEGNRVNIVQTENYRTVRIPFHTTQIAKNPFRDIKMNAVFTGPSGRKIEREAYWNGADRYEIAFAPIEEGKWTYVTESNAPDLNGCTGEVESTPYAGNLEIYRHGFLKISEDKRYFTYADKTPFFWLGDTHWEFAYREKWDKSNHSEMTSMFKGMADRRVSQGYTVYQTNLRSDAVMGGKEKYWDMKNDCPNIEFYQQELDRRMEYIADSGLVNAIGFAWFMSIVDDAGFYMDLTHYFIARYGSLPLVYTLAGEVGGYDKAAQQMFIDGWRPIAHEISKLDFYHHPRTAHYTNERPFPHYYQDEEWMDFTLNQGGHGDYVISANDYVSYLKEYGNKPFVEGEAFYEFCSTLEENGTRMCTDDMLRRVAYLSIQAGGCGYTYGAQGIWDNVWEKGQPNAMSVFNQFDIPWYEAIDGIGGAQMGYMKDFYMKHRFWEMYPYETSDEEGNPFGKKMPMITVSKDKKHWILYYPAATRKTAKLIGFNAAEYKLTWFDPRSNTYFDAGNALIAEGKFEIPKKPDQKDWILVMTQ